MRTPMNQMNRKALILSILVILAILFGGWLFLREPKSAPESQNTPVPPVGVENLPQMADQNRLQHIEPIPGNSDEVWYVIPEMGVRMKLNKEFAEDLVYKLVYKNTTSSEGLDAVYFSIKALLDIDAGCSGSLGGMFLSKGKEMSGNKSGYYESENFGQIIFQFSESFVVWQGAQAGCWDPALEEKVRQIFPRQYDGLGAKNIQEGMKTLNLTSGN